MNPEPDVVLVHGLWMNGWEMGLLHYRLRRAGFRTWRFTYPTRQATVAANAARLHHFLQQHGLTDNLHLVGHSLGGLVILRFLHDFPQWPVRASIALGSPFQGSQAAKQLALFPPTCWLLGRSLPEGLDGTGIRVVPPGRLFGCVVGDRALGLAQHILHLEPGSDGVVTLRETYLEGTQLRLQRPCGHLGLVLSRAVTADIVAFFRTLTP
ncbi:MAG: alpha/beta hydrolase [Magnetococcales bacterium]|nr:alpha/beta hydrolase [Magnetococcales bacterium]